MQQLTQFFEHLPINLFNSRNPLSNDPIHTKSLIITHRRVSYLFGFCYQKSTKHRHVFCDGAKSTPSRRCVNECIYICRCGTWLQLVILTTCKRVGLVISFIMSTYRSSFFIFHTKHFINSRRSFADSCLFSLFFLPPSSIQTLPLTASLAVAVAAFFTLNIFCLLSTDININTMLVEKHYNLSVDQKW